jgi:hypothetical protein
VASKEAAERMSRKLCNRLESLKIIVRSYTAATHFSKADYESAQILVTTVSVWTDMARILGKWCKISSKYNSCLFLNNNDLACEI